MRAADRTAYGNYILAVCLCFQVISYIITYQKQQIMVVVKGRKPLNHLARTYPQKTTSINNNKTTSTTTITAISTVLEPGAHPDNQEKGWTLVTRKKKPHSPAIASESAKAAVAAKTTETTTTDTAPETTAITTETTTGKNTTQSPKKKKYKKREKKTTEVEQPGETETSVNLKRRESGETQAKKFCTQPTHPYRKTPSNRRANPIKNPIKVFFATARSPSTLPRKPFKTTSTKKNPLSNNLHSPTKPTWNSLFLQLSSFSPDHDY